MSKFDNNSLGDGGLQNSKEKQVILTTLTDSSGKILGKVWNSTEQYKAMADYNNTDPLRDRMPTLEEIEERKTP
jgi:hypothetical protein